MDINEEISYNMRKNYLCALHWYLAFNIQGDSLILTHLVRPHRGNGIERICSRIPPELEKNSTWNA